MIPSAEQIEKVMGSKGYKVFKSPGGHDLNIVGIRSGVQQANKFDDLITVFCKLESQWLFWAFPATTDPGAYWLENPMSELGTAILAPGQYRRAFKIGEHQGKYDALIQARPLTVFRDPDRDRDLDTDGQDTETGFFGINIHCAAWQGESVQVDKWSAGCQVIPNWFDFQVLMALASAAEKNFGPGLSYTLLEEKDF